MLTISQIYLGGGACERGLNKMGLPRFDGRARLLSYKMTAPWEFAITKKVGMAAESHDP